MAQWRPDPTFYPSPKHAMEAPAETLAYVAVIDPSQQSPDAICVVDVDPGSPDYGTLVGLTEMPSPGDELHHFGWNACSSCLAPYAAHAHVERRYLIVPGIHSSRIAVMDTHADPRAPKLVKVIEGEEIARKTGYAGPHTVHCGPDAIYLNALGGADGNGPGGIFSIDHTSFEVQSAWEKRRGAQHLAYDFGWHLGQDAIVTSEWGTPNMVKDGLDVAKLMNREYGHRIHVWNLRTREVQQTLDLGSEHQMVLELRPARDPRKAYGFAGVVLSLEDLSSSIWLWYRDGVANTWKVRKVLTIPAEPADAADLPELLKPFGAVPPLVTDINLSLDDRQLYVSCWGTGELKQYDVTDPFDPKETGSIRIGGVVKRTAHPRQPDQALNGGPQMVELSRDGRRVYLTNSLYSPWDAQFYPDGIRGWMVKADINPRGGMALDQQFMVEFGGGLRPHQVRLQGGDASSDAFCFAA